MGEKGGGEEAATTESVAAHKAWTSYFIYSLAHHRKSLLTSALPNYEESGDISWEKIYYNTILLWPCSEIDRLSFLSPNYPANIE